jgi:taurine dioxygenase
MRTRPLHKTHGVELLDFDITKPCSAEDQAKLRRLFLDHHLILVRGQKPSIEDHNRFAAYFGPLSAMLANGDTGYVSNKATTDAAKKDGPPVSRTGEKKLIWHADGTYGPCPGIGTSLLALEVSPGAGPTQFANAIYALETLPAETRARIEPLKAVHMRDTEASDSTRRWRDKQMPDTSDPERIRAHEHPVVYTAPHLEKPILFVNNLMTSHISNLDRDEGDALLEELHLHTIADENVYTHYWEVGDVLIWDNIALQHCRPEDMGNAPRHLRRLSLDGWNNDDGSVIEWFATSTPRDLAKYGRVKEAARYGVSLEM